jgi:hypothetical protein
MKNQGLHRREVIKKIFFSFVVTLPVFHTLFLVIQRKRRGKKVSKKDLLRDHTLAG